MIKNRVLYIKVFFKIHIKNILVSKFKKTSKNNFKKLFSKIIFQTYFLKYFSNKA